METTIKLIDVQPEIAQKADSLYQDKRFVGIVLSTGGGKSFLAMDRIVKQVNEYNFNNSFDENDPVVLSRCPILYFSPTNIVNGQFRTHMTKYIIAPEYLKKDIRANGEITNDNAREALRRLLTKLNIMPEGQKINDLYYALDTAMREDPPKTPEEAILSVVRDELEKAPSAIKDKLVKDAFPGIHFKAYKNLEKIDTSNKKQFEEEYDEAIDEELDDVKDINKINPELIIFDEAHRTGAKTWWPKIESFVQSHLTTKVLAITATPERDVDEQDMMKKLAAIPGMGYSVRERRQKAYLAGDYPLMKALKIGIVNPPEVIHFPMTLDETKEFDDMLRRFIKAAIEDEKVSSHSKNYVTVRSNAATIEKAFTDMLIQIRKNPFESDLQETTNKIRGIESSGGYFSRTPRTKGLVDKLKEKIKELHFEKGVSDKGKDFEQIVSECMELLQNSEWEDGKSWAQVKQERISQTIAIELEKRGLAHGKALTFMDAMPSGTKRESREAKRKRAIEFVEAQKELIRSRIGKILGIEPVVTAIHSTAYTGKQNDDFLNEFMEQSNQEGPLKVIASVQKFNEGFHPDGIGAEFMIKEITENANKASEPRIVLLQQIGRVLSAGKKGNAVIFDLANNFMRNHERFVAEANQDLDCYRFLDLTPEEERFLDAARIIKENSRTRTVQDYHAQETVDCLSVIMKRLMTTQKDLNMPLKQFISRIQNENLREAILDELYLRGIELDEQGDINIGEGLEHIRDVIWERKGSSDKDVLKALQGLGVRDLVNLGIIDLSPTGIKQLRKKTVSKKAPIINSNGFITNGRLSHLYRINVFTGTLLDGPEDDPTSVDYYGCRADGYDPAGYDRFGFNREGIHKVTGMPYDEKGFTKTEDGRWVNIFQEKGSETEELDLLGFNHDGINPKTGFDRDGYWHERYDDGTYSVERYIYNSSNLDVHDFSPRGYYFGQKDILRNNGLFSNGTRHLNPSTPTEFSNKYGSDNRDIDGYDSRGFNRKGIHRDTGLKYDLEGKDVLGVSVDPELRHALEMIELVNRRGVHGIRGKTPEELGRIIYKGISLSRIYYDINKDSPENLSRALMRMAPSRLAELMQLPSGVNDKTIREMQEGFVEYEKQMARFYHEKIHSLQDKNKSAALQYQNLLALMQANKRPMDHLYKNFEQHDDFVR